MKRIKRDYTHAERMTILEYIIDKEGFYCLRGNSIWKNMEQEKILQRTWQSMKEHFRMKIIRNLMFYDISKENRKKIIAGYNNTSTVEKKVIVPKHHNLDFSDEEKETDISMSSDDSDNLVIEVDNNKPSTSKKGFKKQKKSRIKSISDSEESTSKITSPIISNALNQNETNEIDVTSPSIPDVNANNSLSVNVSSTNLEEACVEFNAVDDKNFLLAITKYDSNLLSCACIVTFIKQYRDTNVISKDWTELYDRFINILTNLELYDFLSPENVRKLQNLKEPLEKYRSDGFQEPEISVLPLELQNELLIFTLAPDDYIYMDKESLDSIVILEKPNTDVVSEETTSQVIEAQNELNEKFVSIDDPDIQIKEDNLSSVIDERKTDSNQSNLSDCDSISIQPEIAINLSGIQSNIIEGSEYLEEFNIAEKEAHIIEINLNQSDVEYI